MKNVFSAPPENLSVYRTIYAIRMLPPFNIFLGAWSHVAQSDLKLFMQLRMTLASNPPASLPSLDLEHALLQLVLNSSRD